MLTHAIGTLAVLLAAPAPSRFTNPWQPWASPDGAVHLQRPAVARPTTSDEAISTLMVSGWRLVWDGGQAGPGRMVVRLMLKVAPETPEKTATEVFQVGVSRAPQAVRTCLSFGLNSGSGRRRPDRVINGRRFAVWTNGDAGMNQQIAATDLRTVVDGACWAVERFGFGESASDGDPTVTLSQVRGAAMLDATLASLQLGPLKPARVRRPPVVALPPGAVAR